MTFPRKLVTAIHVGDWVDVSADVRSRPVEITRGRRNEGSHPDPSQCSLVLDNRHGDYSPRNPFGAYFGALGRNTPIRVGLRFDADGFAREVANGWGSTDHGTEWVADGDGSDYSVDSGEAIHSLPTASDSRLSYLPDRLYRDVELALSFTLDVAAVTGGALYAANVVLRAQSVDQYYLLRVAVLPDDSVTASFEYHDSSGVEVLSDPVTIAGVTYSAGSPVRVRAQAEGPTLRARVWSGVEPVEWSVTARDDRITAPGWVGVQSGRADGDNSNTYPLVVTYTDFDLVLPRFSGHIAEWPPRWDLSASDIRAPVEASGVMRRLAQGAELRSTLRRAVADLAPVAYWPGEDARTATRIASAFGDGTAMFISGQADMASTTPIEASAAIPRVAGSAWFATVPAHDAYDGRAQVRWLLSVPSSGVDEGVALIEIGTSGSINRWRIVLGDNGGMAVNAFLRDDIPIALGGFTPFNSEGRPLWMALEFEQTGSQVTYNLASLAPGETSGVESGDSTIAQPGTLGVVTWVRINPLVSELVDDIGIGHISVHDVYSPLSDLADPLNAWRGERAGHRIERICVEQGIPFVPIGDMDTTAPMGPQSPTGKMDVFFDCASADLGTLYESRGDLGLVYRARTELYNQPPALGLDFTAGHIAPPFTPVEDDRNIRNDVTASRSGGSEARSVQRSGRLSVQPPPDGVGVYDASVTVNVAGDDQLANIAGWLLHLGTVDEARYPVVSVNLRTPAVRSLESEILSMDVDDRFTIDGPTPDGVYDRIDQLARGARETIGQYAHTVEFQAAPASPFQVARLDAGYRVDSGASTLDGAIGEADTTVSVAVDSVYLWDTGAVFPFDVRVTGEVMTVTDVSGATSPQTFTVVRGANGVARPHAEGDSVRLADRPVISL